MKKKDVEAVSKKQVVGKVFVQIGLYAFLIVMALIVLFPFYWMLISSLKTVNEYNASVPTLWPQQFKWSNYAVAFDADGLNLGRLFLNTCIVGIVSTILSLIVTVLSAYAFARLEFKGKNIMFAAMLGTMMIPGELFTITNYVTVAAFQWTNTFTALIVPFLVSVFYIYLLRQNFMQIPNELYLAAKVDGSSDLKYLWKVMIPLSAPTLISITILKMMGAWNSYVWPNLVANDMAHRLITVGLRGASFIDQATQMTDYPAQMAAVVIVTIPLLLVFLFFRKYIMRGVSRSGLKG
ncbi:MAG: carbohydrate ABC transporter permease [Clostridia bacterium]|nr:carbohydrate ABC transporter permease [Clostridia bacterium]